MSRNRAFTLLGIAALPLVLLAGARLAPAQATAPPQWTGHHHGQVGSREAASARDELARHLEAARSSLESARREADPALRSDRLMEALAQLIDAVEDAAWQTSSFGDHHSGHHSEGAYGYHHDSGGCGG